MRRLYLVTLLLCLAAPVVARRQTSLCGTSGETAGERLFLHRQALRARKGLRPLALPAPSKNHDIGDIAIIEDAAGIVARQNEFNLDGKTLRFTPSAPAYRYSVADGGYDAAAAAAGAPLVALDDDDSRPLALEFAFPFFGNRYRDIYINSDGDLTFRAADSASTDRSLGRFTAGPPRIAPLFEDVNPAETAGGVRVLSEPGRVVVSWVGVPEWVEAGTGTRQTFQVRLYPDGSIEFSYNGVAPASAVVGIAPGSLNGAAALVDYRNDESAAYTAAVAERFGNTLDIDIVTLAQRFYETHEDAYDYLAVFNSMEIPALGSGVIAYESTVRSRGSGYGVVPRDDGAQYGSASRLQAVLNLGPLSQYPQDPNALLPPRAQAGDTTLSTIAHEAGHLFLAYASAADPNDPVARPMLGYQGSHWSFLFNSEASLLEGEKILDRGADVSPRFITAETAKGYAPLDQYLMGWLAPADVPETFVVTGAPAYMKNWHPARGVAFDGVRQDVAVSDLVQAMGRRTPDHTLAQRRYRFAFILVTPPGADTSAADLAQLDAYRQQFEQYFAKASDNRAAAETTLRRSLKLSLSPAAGVVEGLAGTATLTVQTPPLADLSIAFQTPHGNAAFPASVTIPAGMFTVSFQYSGVAAGVEEVAAIPLDPAYETASARVQVGGPEQLELVQVSADPVIVRLTDANGLAYAGARVVASVSAGGAVSPASAMSDAGGLATFRWTPGAAPATELRLALDALPSVSLTLRAGSAVPAISAVVNSASFAGGMAAGALETIFGARLAGARVTLDGADAPVLYAGDSQVNFYVPAATPPGPATLVVTAPSGETAARAVEVTAVQPGIFAVRDAGNRYLEIYCTGLGPLKTAAGLAQTAFTPVVFLGAVPVQPLYSGPAAGTPGLYQVNVRIPDAIGSGPLAVLLSVNLQHSNEVTVPAP